jgi:tRNA uridine 5-carbamoylmethylation protein Kti12
MNKNVQYLLVGLPFSGKTSLAKEMEAWISSNLK